MGATQYPKKYWWVILVVVPVLIVLVAVLPGLVSSKGGGADGKNQGGTTQIGNGNVAGSGNIVGSDLSRKMYFINVETIAKEIKESGQTLSDEMRAQIQKAIDLSLAGRIEDSIRNWKDLSGRINSPSIEYKLAIANTKAGNVDAARSALKKAIAQKPDFETARASLALLDSTQTKSSPAGITTEEAEPNDTISQANDISLNTDVQGYAAKSSDKDFLSSQHRRFIVTSSEYPLKINRRI